MPGGLLFIEDKMKDKKLEKNVLDIMDKFSTALGNFDMDTHDRNMFFGCVDSEMESPIEHILYCALYTVAHLNFIKEAEPLEISGKWFSVGLGVFPQQKIDHYRVDFLVSFGYPILNSDQSPKYKEIIVECDSQEFHERTEEERRYEKKRDRFLQQKGYEVFRYTGADICRNSLCIAKEIISFITGIKEEDLDIGENGGL